MTVFISYKIKLDHNFSAIVGWRLR